jgi:CTP:phosphocholine cytidylyltransferase-like protein
MNDFIKIPSNVKRDALLGLRMIENGYRGGQDAGRQRAKQLSNDTYISVHDLYAMKNFYSRHMITSLTGYIAWVDDGKPIEMVQGFRDKRRGAVALLIWGGLSAFEWLRTDQVKKLLDRYYPNGKNELGSIRYYLDRM